MVYVSKIMIYNQLNVVEQFTTSTNRITNLKLTIMELKKEDIYGELKWVSDMYGKFEVLVDTGFMSINNPLIRLQIDKRFKDKREELAEIMHECLYFADDDGGKEAMSQTLDDLFADFLDVMNNSLNEEFAEDEPVSIEYANKCIKEWESL